jgi:hypothetical protein
MGKQNKTNGAFTAAYPNIAYWVEDCGYIEIGYDDCSQSFARALNAGGMVWESEDKYDTVDEALQAMEEALTAWLLDEEGE